MMTGGRVAEVQEATDLELRGGRGPNENEAGADGEEGAEHAEGDPDREQRDAGAEESFASGGPGESAEPGDRGHPEEERRIQRGESRLEQLPHRSSFPCRGSFSSTPANKSTLENPLSTPITRLENRTRFLSATSETCGFLRN